jgi:hypothetical protein
LFFISNYQQLVKVNFSLILFKSELLIDIELKTFTNKKQKKKEKNLLKYYKKLQNIYMNMFKKKTVNNNIILDLYMWIEKYIF